MLDPCRDQRGALGAAALAGGDPADDIALRAHLDGCAACRAELRELTLVAVRSPRFHCRRSMPRHPSRRARWALRVLDRLARERDAMQSKRVRRAFAGSGAFAGYRGRR